MDRKPEWQIPTGMTRGLLDYADSPMVAQDYDYFFAENSLFDFDKQILREEFGPDDNGKKLIADFGCGTGRALLPFLETGFSGMAIDMSENMLKIVREKFQYFEEQYSQDSSHGGLNNSLALIKANLVELDCIKTSSVDHGMSMFSTLGMIFGHECRLEALRHSRRIVKPGGKFVIHVHNYWYNWIDSAGRRQILIDFLNRFRKGKPKRGDRFFPYRGIAQMYLHIFSKSEITGLLRDAGFKKLKIIPLSSRRNSKLRFPMMLGRIRANGWIIVCS